MEASGVDVSLLAAVKIQSEETVTVNHIRRVYKFIYKPDGQQRLVELWVQQFDRKTRQWSTRKDSSTYETSNVKVTVDSGSQPTGQSESLSSLILVNYRLVSL